MILEFSKNLIDILVGSICIGLSTDLDILYIRALLPAPVLPTIIEACSSTLINEAIVPLSINVSSRYF